MTDSVQIAKFICLANSRKKGGRCLAGKTNEDDTYSKWLRPVTEHSSEELQYPEYCLQSGGEVSLLDLVEVRLTGSVNFTSENSHQQENKLMDVSVPIKKYGSISVSEASKMADMPINLWGTGSSTKNGTNNCVPISEIDKYQNSLYLILVHEFRIEIRREFNRRTMRGIFNYQENQYKLKITDPHFEEKFQDKPLGDFEIDKTLLTISLGEKYFGDYYKLIAGIIPMEYGTKWGIQ